MESDDKGDGGLAIEGIALKLTAATITRATPPIWSWLLTRFGGLELLVLGPGGAGKTSFADYLRFGTLDLPSARHHKTVEVTTSGSFTLQMGRDRALKLRVKRTVDVPGQTGPAAHAELLAKRRPDVLMILLDAGCKVSENADWLTQFCDRLDHLARQDSALLAKTKHILIVVNKVDALPAGTSYADHEKALRDVLRASLQGAFSKSQIDSIPIQPCVAIQSPSGSLMIDNVIEKIGKMVAKS